MAITRLTALTADTHAGSLMWLPSDSGEFGITVVLQSMARAHMLNAEARGPKVPDTNGFRVDKIHQDIGAFQSNKSQ